MEGSSPSQTRCSTAFLFASLASFQLQKATVWYVTISRGRRGIRIFTPDKEQLRENVARSGHRLLAMEFASGFVPRRGVRLWDRLHGYLLRFGRKAADDFVRLKLARRRNHQLTQKYEHKITRMLGERSERLNSPTGAMTIGFTKNSACIGSNRMISKAASCAPTRWQAATWS